MQNRCPNCMEEIKPQEKCPHCGYLIASEQQNGALPVGTLLSDRYYIGRVVTADTVSVVYMGYDTGRNARVFVRESVGTAESKEENAGEPAAEDPLTERFIQYGRSLASVSLCPLIPRTVDIFEEANRGYIVTEYFEGESLRELLKAGIHISAGHALRIAEQLCEGLRFLHKSHMIFGAISPQTLYILKDGGVRLFGLGSPFYENIDDLDERVERINPSYAAPELFEPGAQRGTFSDVYSVAAILYRILTDTIPPVSFLRSEGESLISPRRKNKRITRSVSSALFNALNWPVEQRTKTVDAFLKELSAARVGRRRSVKTVWADCLGLLNRVTDRISVVCAGIAQKLGRKKQPDGKQNLHPSRKKWLAVILPIIAVLLVGVTVFVVWSIVSRGPGGSAVSSSDGWYYGEGKGNTDSSFHSFVNQSSSRQSNSTSSASTASYDFQLGENQTICPDLVGMYVERAIYELEISDLKVGKITYEASSHYAEGNVISQSVPAGTRVEYGKAVGLVVSSGVPQEEQNSKAEVPQAVGLELSEALASLRKAGFENLDIIYRTGSEPTGTVMAQSASAGEKISTSEQIILTVCGRLATVPDFSGKTLERAYAIGGDFTFVTVTESGTEILVSPAAYTHYEVVGQDIKPAFKGYQGQKITLTVKDKE